MNCPRCKSKLVPWPWQDGGYKGLGCESCGLKWWSDVFADAAYEAAKSAVEEVVARSEFPADAVEDEEQQRRWKETLDGRGD